METSLNGMAEINEFDKHDIAGLKGIASSGISSER